MISFLPEYENNELIPCMISFLPDYDSDEDPPCLPGNNSGSDSEDDEKNGRPSAKTSRPGSSDPLMRSLSCLFLLSTLRQKERGAEEGHLL